VSFEPALARHAIRLDATHPGADQRARWLAAETEKLKAIAKRLDPDEQTIQVTARWSKHAWTALEEILNEQNFDLIIKGTHQQNPIQRTFFSSTDWDLMRCSSVPVLLIKDQPWPEHTLNLTACVDPSEPDSAPHTLNETILKYAKAWQDTLGGQLNILHAYDPTPFLVYMEPPVPDTTEISDALSQQHQAALDQLLSDCDLSPSLGRLEAGSPLRVIPDWVARSDTHVVMLGAQNRVGFNRWLMGHTAEKILDRMSCDILVIKATTDTP
jgi:universal stress protein E